MIATIRTLRLPRSRRGFTLVELLVAMALIIFIMVILTEAFSAGTGAFRALKSAGDMQERLRAAESLIRQDMVHYHFNGSNKLSTLSATSPPNQGYFYIQQYGSYSESIAGDSYGNYSKAMWPTAQPFMCFTINYTKPPNLQPALADPGNLPGDFFTARIPDAPGSPGVLPLLGTNEQPLFKCGPLDYLPQPTLGQWSPTNRNNNVVISQWAEVAYFLVPTGRVAGTTTAPWPGATTPPPLYSLRRRIRVVLNTSMTQANIGTPPSNATNDDTAYNTLNNPNSTNPGGPRIFNAPVPGNGSPPTQPTDVYNARFAEMSCFPEPTTNFLFFNSPGDLCKNTNNNRMYSPRTYLPLGPGLVPLSPIGSPPQSGSGQLNWAGDDLLITDVLSFNIRVLTPSATDFADLGSGGSAGTYTADNTNTATLVNALEITIRIWDPKTSLARQVTIIQDM
jgi:prepilin-type N-terminal cleavage/methylation domain-containing protein